MELVISIVSWNTKGLLRACLASLVKHCRPDHTKIVVIDNASSDGSPEMVREEFPQVHLVETGANLGFGRAHNLIAEESDEAFVLFLNPDAEFVENSHEKMLEVFRDNPDVGIVGCRMTNPDGSIQPLGYQRPTSPWGELISGLLVSSRTMALARRVLPYHDPEESGFVKKLYGGCLMVRREVLDQVGWFDERFFMYGEDVDLCRRADAAGWRIYYRSDTNVVHLGGGASEKAPGRFSILMQCESIAKLMRKYYGPIGKVGYVAAILVRAVSRLSAALGLQFVLKCMRRPVPAPVIHSRKKHLAMLRWGLRFDRPTIPK